jgi:hypothetical protein
MNTMRNASSTSVVWIRTAIVTGLGACLVYPAIIFLHLPKLAIVGEIRYSRWRRGDARLTTGCSRRRASDAHKAVVMNCNLVFRGQPHLRPTAAEPHDVRPTESRR